MDKTTAARRGVIEGAARILRELLRTPKWRETTRLLLSELDPENAPLLVRTLRAEDPDLFMNLLAASPALANAAVGVACEMLAQIQTLPPGLTAAFVERIARDLDAGRLGETAGRAAALAIVSAERGGEGLARATAEFGERFGAGVLRALRESGVDPDTAADAAVSAALSAGASFLAAVGRAVAREDSKTRQTVTRMAEGFREFAAANPDLVDEVIRPALAAVTGKKGDD